MRMETISDSRYHSQRGRRSAPKTHSFFASSVLGAVHRHRRRAIVGIKFLKFIDEMKRENLKWFAGGAGCSALVAVVAAIAIPSPPQEEVWTLRVAEEVQSLQDGPSAAIWRGAEIARDCGARSFEMIPGAGSDQVDATRIPLVRENNPALFCVMERARDAGLWIGVQQEPIVGC